MHHMNLFDTSFINHMTTEVLRTRSAYSYRWKTHKQREGAC